MGEDVNPPEESLLDKMNRRRRELGLGPPQETVFQHDPDVIPEEPERETRVNPEEAELDAVLDRVGIAEAYERWCGKMKPKIGSKRESIMISCPVPGHADKNPSAWMNLDKDVWHCGACELGGDKYTIASYKFGLDEKNQFPDLRRAMGEDLGYIVHRTLSGTEYVEKDDEKPVTSDAAGFSDSKEPVKLASVTPLPEDRAFEEEIDRRGISLDWESVTEPDTFLDEWMSACTVANHLPDEYYFWLGMQALGLAVGHDVTIADGMWPIRGNLYVCLFGPSGTGKTRAFSPYKELLSQLPWKHDEFEVCKGIKQIHSPGSSEALIDSFVQQVWDPSDTAKEHEPELKPVRGWLEIPELAALISRSARAGNPLKETITELFDGTDVTIHSRGAGDIMAHSPFASIASSTQPKAIHDFLSRTDAASGFLNRWIFAVGQPRRDLVRWGSYTPSIGNSADYLKRIHAWSGKPRVMTMSHDCLDVWNPFWDDKFAPIVRGEVEDEMQTRLELTIKKCILLLTINERLDNPTPAIIEKAISLFKYLQQTLTLFGASLAHDEKDECWERLEELIKMEPQGPRELMRKVHRTYKKEMVINTLRVMEGAGVIKEVLIKAKRGPAAKKYEWVDDPIRWTSST